MIRGRITEGDLVAAQRLHGEGVRKRSYTIALICAAYGLATMLVTNEGRGQYIAIGSLSFAAVVWISDRFVLPMRMRRLFLQQPEFQGEFSYSWDATFVMGESSTGHSKRPWKSYLKIAEGKDVLLLYQSDNLFEMIPKRWFAGEQQLQEFRNVESKARRA